MKCYECEKDTEDVQTFTLKDPEQSINLCREHYEMLKKNNRVTGKLVIKKCNACHQFIGYEWIKYKPSGRPRKGSKSAEKLDDFFDMRSSMERAFTKKKKAEVHTVQVDGDTGEVKETVQTIDVNEPDPVTNLDPTK